MKRKRKGKEKEKKRRRKGEEKEKKRRQRGAYRLKVARCGGLVSLQCLSTSRKGMFSRLKLFSEARTNPTECGI